MQLNLYYGHANFQEKSALNIVYLIMVPSGALGPGIASLNAVKGSIVGKRVQQPSMEYFLATDQVYFGWGVLANFHVFL
jgi:hypothetical protein